MLCPAQTSTPASVSAAIAPLGASSRRQRDDAAPARGSAQPLDHLRVDGGEARLVMDALFRGVEMRPLDMQAQHAGYALFQRCLARRQRGIDDLRMVADQRRHQAGGAELAMRLRDGADALDAGLVVEQHIAAAIDLRVDKAGQQRAAAQIDALIAVGHIAGRGKAQDPPVRDQQRLMLHDPVRQHDMRAKKRSRPGHNVRVTLLRWGGLSGLQPRAGPAIGQPVKLWIWAMAPMIG
jgi:hypothetical protein